MCGSTNPRLRIVVGWMVGRGWMVGWVVSTCVTTRHHTTLGGERLLSLVWFWLFGVWVVGWMVGRVVGMYIYMGVYTNIYVNIYIGLGMVERVGLGLGSGLGSGLGF